MILVILTFILGYDMKTAVGTSVLIMTCTAFSGFPIKEVLISSVEGIIGVFRLTMRTLSTLRQIDSINAFMSKIEKSIMDLSPDRHVR